MRSQDGELKNGTVFETTAGDAFREMDETTFENLLEQSVAEFPPEDIIKEVTSWRKAMQYILIGLALCSVTLNFWNLQYILPACGMVLTFLGFRALRRENKWFRSCFIISAVRMVYCLQMLILNTTVFHNVYSSTPLALALTIANLALLLAEIFCFWRGILAAQKKVGLPPKADNALALLSWYSLLIFLGSFSFAQPILMIALIICFFSLIRSLYNLSKELEGIGYSVQPVPVKIPNPCIISLLLVVLISGCTVGYLFGGSYPMGWKNADPLEQAKVDATRQHLLELGFPEYVLNDLAPEDIAACEGALQVVSDVTEEPVNEGRPIKTEYEDQGRHVTAYSRAYDIKELRITGVGVQMPGDREHWIVFHHFLWVINPGFYGTESILLYPAYKTTQSGWGPDGNVRGRVLYDKDGETFTSPYHSLGLETYVSNNIFSSGEKRTDVFATFSMPGDAENQRCYLTYSTLEMQDGWILNSWVEYTHQQTWLQYPALTAMEARMTNFIPNTRPFITLVDALQFYSTEDGVKMLGKVGTVK